MIRCASCSTDLPDESRFCLSCGAAIDTSMSPTLLHVSGSPEASKGRGETVRETTTDSPRFYSSDSIDEAKFVPGTLLAGRYRIVGLLGRGGMGEVYRADDLKLAHPVALKLLPERLSNDGAALARFHREVRIARQVSHPNVCRVFDISEIEGLHFLSMEYIDGEDLASLLRRIGRLPEDKALEIARQLCAGLAAAHDNGVLHRDLKPSNVMIDGRGRARITDFGLAVLTDQPGREQLAGTPAYMAPEQLTGEEATTRSDIFALGLILYEVFTGRRAFRDSDVSEMVRKRERLKPDAPSSLVREIDPLIEEVIMRCLEKDPSKRPSSALLVSAMLPGGDPLQAALAAGETPSPEMVADAPAKGALRPAVAWACLTAFIIGLTCVVLLSDKVELHRQVPLDKSPEVLADRAGTLLARLGYRESPKDRAWGFGRNAAYLQYLMEQDKSPARWEKLAAGRPWGVTFWYRQSANRLQPRNFWDVTLNDPPLSEPGMANLLLDTRGRLIDLYCLPPPVDAQPSSASSFDWSELFTAAELDLSKFVSVESRWVPPAPYDQRTAWDGVFPEQPDIPLHIEAAAYRGKPVYLEMFGPWTRPARLGAEEGARTMSLQILMLSMIVACMIGGGLLARRNLRFGRGDRRGALRLAFYVFVVSMLGWVFGAKHVPLSSPIDGVLPIAWVTPVVWTLYTVTFLWGFYIALEPNLRQRWPHRIISWTRLLAGRFRDPLVGRDLLIGGLFGVAIILVNYAGFLIPKLLGSSAGALKTIDFGTMLGLRGVFERLCEMQIQSLVNGFGTMILLLLFFLCLRRQWLAAIGVWLLLVSMRLLSEDITSITHTISTGLEIALFMAVLMRYGLLAGIAAQFFTWCWNYPLTADFSTWYAGSGQFAIAIAAGVAIYGFYCCLARQPRNFASTA